jgi:hypothetical protein
VDGYKLLEKLLDKQEKLSEKQEDMNIILAENTVILKEHERRSLANEEAVILIREEIKPIQKHVDSVHTGLKLMGAVSIIISILAGVVKIVQFFR